MVSLIYKIVIDKFILATFRSFKRSLKALLDLEGVEQSGAEAATIVADLR